VRFPERSIILKEEIATCSALRSTVTVSVPMAARRFLLQRSWKLAIADEVVAGIADLNWSSNQLRSGS
jgi:hypothetical protein